MLTPIEVFLFSAATLLLLPITIAALLGGMTAPCSNLFLLAVCGSSLSRLGQHFGFISQSAKDQLELLIGE